MNPLFSLTTTPEGLKVQMMLIEHAIGLDDVFGLQNIRQQIGGNTMD